MAKEKKTYIRNEGIVLENLRTMTELESELRVLDVVTKASAEEAGVAKVTSAVKSGSTADDDDAESEVGEIASIDMPMFRDAPRFKYQPQPGDDIDVSGNPSTLINL